ncbi:nucleotidyltransferase family protein [Candidatus Woesearchaeota archaeon]|nr:nucleotidyltransferase family protein [Candidatus Woesearchaeota archaeon]
MTVVQFPLEKARKPGESGAPEDYVTPATVSELPHNYPEEGKVVCVMMAGYQPGNPFMVAGVDGVRYRKHAVPLDGRSPLERNIAAVRNSCLVSRLFIVGDEDELRPIAERYPKSRACSVWPVQQEGSLSENLVAGIGIARRYNESRIESLAHAGKAVLDDRVLIVTGDSLLEPRAVAYFVNLSRKKADFVVGAADKEHFDRMLSDLELEIDGPKTKMNFFPVGGRMVRVNNMFMLRYSAVDPDLFWFMDQAYHDRQLVDDGGAFKRSSIAAMVRRSVYTLDQYQRRKGIPWRGKARLNLYGAAFGMALSYLCRPFSRLMFTKRDVELVFTQNFGISCEFLTSEHFVKPVLDIDVQAMYDFLAGEDRDFGPYRKIKDYDAAGK